jgi:hypothetical protein
MHFILVVLIFFCLISSGCINGGQRLDAVLNPKPMEVENSSDVDKAIEKFRGSFPENVKENIEQKNGVNNPNPKPDESAGGSQEEGTASGDGSGKSSDASGEENAKNNGESGNGECNPIISKGNDTGLFLKATFFHKLQEAAACPKDKERVSFYMHAGIALSDELCSVWFDRLGKAQAKVNADRDILSNVGALTGAILGFSGAGGAVAGGAAAGFGFLENSFDSELANFIVAPDISEVQEAIDVDRKSRALALEGLSTEVDFFQARAELIRYDNTCSHLAVKRKVNESVGNATQKTKRQIEAISATVFDTYVNAKKAKVEADERLVKAIDEKKDEEGREKENALIEKANERLKKIFNPTNLSTVKDLKIDQIIAFYVRLNNGKWDQLEDKQKDDNYRLIDEYLSQNKLDEKAVAIEGIRTAFSVSVYR